MKPDANADAGLDAGGTAADAGADQSDAAKPLHCGAGVKTAQVVRPHDTADTVGPYLVSGRVLGSPPGDGPWWIDYATTAGVLGRVALEPGPSGWLQAAIPGAPAGSEVRFHVSSAGDAGWRWPRLADYRFRVLSARVAQVDFDRHPRPGPQRVKAVVESGAAPAGVVSYRYGDRDESWHDVALDVVSTAPGRFDAAATIPSAGPGGVVDFYIDLGAQRAPADAPARFYSYKERQGSVLDLPGFAGASAVILRSAGPGPQRAWLGGRGGVLAPSGLLGAVDGIAGGNVQALAMAGGDTSSLVVETTLGVVEATPAGNMPIIVPQFQMSTGSPSALAASAVDGAVMIGFSAHVRDLSELPRFTTHELWTYRDDTLTAGPSVDQLTDLPIIHIDESDGCFYLGGVAKGAALYRYCGDTLEAALLPDAVVKGGRVLAFARSPADGLIVAAVSVAPVNQDDPVETLLVRGTLETGFAESGRVQGEVTSMASDPVCGWLAVGTAKDGFLVDDGRGWRPVQGLPSAAITSVAGDPYRSTSHDSAAFVIGHRAGASLLGDDGQVQAMAGLPDRPFDLSPTDVTPSGDIVLTSNSSGVFIMDGDGAFVSSYRAGRELPGGVYGQAKYDASRGVVWALRYGPRDSVLSMGPGGVEERTMADGLAAAHEIIDVMPDADTGNLWITYGGSPFGDPFGWQVYDPNLRTGALCSHHYPGPLHHRPGEPGMWGGAAGFTGVIGRYNEDCTYDLFNAESANYFAEEPGATGATRMAVAGPGFRRYADGKFETLSVQITHPRYDWCFDWARWGFDVDADDQWWAASSYTGCPGAVAQVSPGAPGGRVFDFEDGLHDDVREIKVHRPSGRIVVGSSSGLSLIAPE